MKKHATLSFSLIFTSEFSKTGIRKRHTGKLCLCCWHFLFPLLLSITLAGCAGSGGGSNPIPSPPPHVVGTTYSNDKEIVAYSDGSIKTYTATSNTVTWATDHITKTITYTFADSTMNPVVTTVPSVAGTSYIGSTQTIITTYGDGTTAISTNTAISNLVIWATDHVTKTTTYTFADSTTNPIVTTVPGTVAPADFVATAASYPANWTTTGLVTKPNISRYVVTYGDGFTLARSGTALDPYAANVVSTYGVFDPNAAVRTASNVVYDLHWGTPDTMGPTYASWFSTGSSTFSATFLMNRWVSGQCISGPTLGGCTNGFTVAAPHPDVIDAWNQGWTGKGVNILMVDSFGVGQNHGVTTTLLAARYAMGAFLYGTSSSMDYSWSLPGDVIRNYSGTIAIPSVPNTSFGVVNNSFGLNIWFVAGHSGTFTPAEIATANADPFFMALADVWSKALDGRIFWTGFNLTDAVITKSAGNDAVTANNELLSKTYAYNSSIAPRLLIVGALNWAGFTNSPATIAAYSNTAGTDLKIQNRFLVASGTTPFGNFDLAVDGNPVTSSGNEGTSYAAPRVAGYAAIVRQKFPNVTGANTADIMLQTARYDTLSCYYTVQGCDKTIYGQGEVSLSRALAPVGLLR